ncbi:response regulator, partial [Tyzzerella sp. OttesenSCG-928-J15]|nr:response regulator [Tyzzerella sp. OttesenSCG-928-J15]
MNIIAVDDERPALNVLARAIKEAAPDCNISTFLNPLEALNYVEEQQVDIAFLDVRMGDMDGVTLAGRLKIAQPKLNIIFVTGYERYMEAAFGMHASGYILKPVSADDVREELNHLRYKPEALPKKRIYIQTFGNFDVFVNDEPVIFRRTRAKEILAYLVDRRGATVTKKELAAVLWGDGDYNRNMQKHLQMLIAELQRALLHAGAAQTIRRQQNS